MLGCDIIEISRIEESLNKFGDSFVERILSEREIEIYHSKGKKSEFVAGRFAAKEAISKAMGTGIGRNYDFVDIEILPNELGKPEVYLKGVKSLEYEVSISHSKTNAIAVSMKKSE